MGLGGYSVLYNSKNTQRTYRRLTAQVINLYGIPIRYLPKTTSDQEFDPFGSGTGTDDDIRSNTGLNELYGEDVNIAFKDAVPMKAVLQNTDFYDGTHNLFDKFGMSSEDEITLNIEIETWRNLMDRSGYPMEKPMEGDLITFDLARAKNGRPQIFEIKYCNESKSYFQFGELMVFELQCKLWEYGHETLDTGDPIIDGLNDIAGDDSKVGDNQFIKNKADDVVVWDPNDPFRDKSDE